MPGKNVLLFLYIQTQLSVRSSALYRAVNSPPIWPKVHWFGREPLTQKSISSCRSVHNSNIVILVNEWSLLKSLNNFKVKVIKCLFQKIDNSIADQVKNMCIKLHHFSMNKSNMTLFWGTKKFKFPYSFLDQIKSIQTVAQILWFSYLL